MGLVSSIIFAFSNTIWLALFAQILRGVFGATSTLSKGRLGEVSNIELRAWGYSMYGVAYSLSHICGPPLAGFLYSSNDNINVYPFMTVCLSASCVYIAALGFTSKVVEGSSGIHDDKPIKLVDEEKCKDDADREFCDFLDAEDASPLYPSLDRMTLSSASTIDDKSVSFLTHLKSIPILLYCILGLLDSMMHAFISLFLSASISAGGLGLTPSEIAVPMAFMAVPSLCMFKAF
jgi:hypothetical protein